MSKTALLCPWCEGLLEELDVTATADDGRKTLVYCRRCRVSGVRGERPRCEPGPATAKMLAKVAADVKYEEERMARMGGTLDDEDEESTWYTVGVARAFLAENEPAGPE